MPSAVETHAAHADHGTPERPLQHIRLWRSLGALAIVATWIACLLPVEHLPSLNSNDKLLHLAGYATLAFSLAQHGIYPLRPSRIALALCVMGVVIECLQPLTGRSFEWADMLANAVGAGIGASLAATPLGACARLVEQGVRRG